MEKDGVSDKLFRFKYVIAIALVAVLIGASAENVAFSTLPSPTVATYNNLAGVRDCSYVISTNGSTVYAQNGNTGAILSSGTDADTVIQTAIDTLEVAGVGGTVCIKAGTYNLQPAITIQASNIVVKGEGMGTILQKPTGGTGAVISLGDGITTYNDIQVKDLQIKGIATASRGIVANRTDYLQLQNLVIGQLSAAGATGIEITTQGRFAASIRIIDVRITATNAINVHGESSTNAVTNVRVIGGNFFGVSNTGVGLNFTNVGTSAIVDSPNISSFNPGVNIQTFGSNTIVTGRFESNTVDVTVGSGISNTLITQSTGLTNISDSGSNTVIVNNAAYKTMNTFSSGTFSLTSTGIKTLTVPHGLNYTPATDDCAVTLIEVTPVTDGRIDWIKVSATNSTHITAKVDVGVGSGTGGATAKLGFICIRG